MRLTIDVPWLTYSRRLWVMLTALLLLLAMALPASAAPPDGVSGEVTVINEGTNPVPMTVENDATAPIPVTGGNTTPVAVSGDVNATVQGTVDVSGQTYDGDGNLYVNANAPVTDILKSVNADVNEGATHTHLSAPDHVTAVSLTGIQEQQHVEVVLDDISPGPLKSYTFTIHDDETIVQSFPIPIAGVDQIQISCISTASAACNIKGTVAGY